MNSYQKSKKRLALFGAGVEGERFYYYLSRQGYIVEKIFDTFKKGNFHGKEIQTISDAVKNYFLLVTSYKYYEEIKLQLEKLGLREFFDFAYCYEGIKKLVLLNVNCYGCILQEYLYTSEDFKQNYYIHPLPAIQNNIGRQIPEELLNACDVYIHQDIRWNNAYGYMLSDEYIGKKLRKDCINITIPNLVGLGKIFFPQGEVNDERNRRDDLMYGFFPYKDIVVDTLLKQGKSAEQIIEQIKQQGFYEEQYIIDNFYKIIEKYREREKGWDIKVIDYILEHYRARKLFYDIYHPVNEILELIAGGVLKELGLDSNGISCDGNLGAYEMFLYPEVKKALGLEYSETEIRKTSKYKLMPQMDMEEYVKEYIYWCRN